MWGSVYNSMTNYLHSQVNFYKMKNTPGLKYHIFVINAVQLAIKTPKFAVSVILKNLVHKYLVANLER